jgi:ABC-type uncharacterized transport system involved in gliding motility auxiliary subunit
MATEARRTKVAAQTGLYLLVISAICVMANVFAAGLHFRFDRTLNERFTLSQGSASLVQSLKEPITIEAYVERGLPVLDVFVRDLTALLNEYERAGKGKFRYTIIEPDTQELQDQAKEAGLEPMAFGAAEDNKTSFAQGYMGLVLKYRSEKDVIPQLDPRQGSGLEFWVTNKIRELRDKADDVKHKIGVVTGKDELKLDDNNLVPKQGGQQGGVNIKGIFSQAFPFYTFEDVAISEGSEISPELAGLIITQPRKEYTDGELKRIDDFLMLGNKSLAVFASAVSMKPNDATMAAELNLYGLDKLTAGYGINIKKDAVFDFGAQFGIPVMTQGGVVSIRHPGIAHVTDSPYFEDDKETLDTSFASFFRLPEIAFPFPSSLEILKDKQPSDVQIKVVARTTPNASVISEGSVDMKLRNDWRPKPPFEQRPIAAVSEGKLKSAFGDARAAEASRVLVISSSEFLTNPFAYAGNGPEMDPQFAMFGGVGGDRDLQMIAQPYAQRYLTQTILSLKNTLDWMSGDADLLAVSAKIIGDANLNYSSIKPPAFSAEDDEAAIQKKDEEYRAARKNLQGTIKWTLTLGLPLAFAVFGFLRWRGRLAKKNQYSVA